LSFRQHIDQRGDTVTFSTPKEEAPHGGAGLLDSVWGIKVMGGGIPITNRGIERARDKHKSSLLIRMIRLTYQWWAETQAEADAPQNREKPNDGLRLLRCACAGRSIPHAASLRAIGFGLGCGWVTSTGKGWAGEG